VDFAGCVLKKFVCNLQSFNKIKRPPSQVANYHCDPDGARTHDPQLRRPKHLLFITVRYSAKLHKILIINTIVNKYFCCYCLLYAVIYYFCLNNV